MQDIIQNMNWIDYIIVAIFLLSILAGLFRGLFREIISLCTLIAAFIVATLFASPLAVAFTNTQSVQNVVNNAASSETAAQSVSYVALGLSFAVLFIATMIVGAIIGLILNMIFHSTTYSFGNRLLGGVFGFFRGFLINLVLIFLVQLTSFSNDSAWTESKLVAAYQPAVQWLGNVVSPSLADLKEKFDAKMHEINNNSNHTN